MLVLALAGCAAMALLLESSRRRMLTGLSGAARVLLSLAVCACLGLGVAALGSHGGLLFLPCLFVLGTIATLSRPSFLACCSIIVAAGFLLPAVDSEGLQWSSPFAAAALVVLPLGFQRLFRGLGPGSDGNRGAAPAEAAPAIATQRLTPRQAEVAAMLARGMRHGEIAEELGVSTSQVRRLIRQARERTGARTSAELVARSVGAVSDNQAE
jgi:DNA-binding CsgD family transcriptional regulator